MQGSRLWRLSMIFRRGYVYEHEECLQHLEWFTQGLTFREAHERTGRVVCITCTPAKMASGSSPPLILNHLNAPNVTLGSAVLASSCVPGLIPPVTLQEKVDGVTRPWSNMTWEKSEDEQVTRLCRKRQKPVEAASEDPDNLQEVLMRDGSFESDVPVSAMSSLFNTHFSIVSQVNPHIIPFFYNPTGVPGRPIRWPWRKYRGGFLVHLLEVWLKEDMIKNLLILQKTGLLFNVLGVDWSYIWTQQNHGELTIIPTAGFFDYFHVMDNVQSHEYFVRMLKHSERNAWRNFTQIQFRTRLQRALHRVGESVIEASEAASPGVRQAVLRRCGPVHEEPFLVRGAPKGSRSSPRSGQS